MVSGFEHHSVAFQPVAFVSTQQCSTINFRKFYAVFWGKSNGWLQHADFTSSAACRYACSSAGGLSAPLQKLPGWMHPSIQITNGDFGPGYQRLAAFFRSRKQQQQLLLATPIQNE